MAIHAYWFYRASVLDFQNSDLKTTLGIPNDIWESDAIFAQIENTQKGYSQQFKTAIEKSDKIWYDQFKSACKYSIGGGVALGGFLERRQLSNRISLEKLLTIGAVMLACSAILTLIGAYPHAAHAAMEPLQKAYALEVIFVEKQKSFIKNKLQEKELGADIERSLNQLSAHFQRIVEKDTEMKAFLLNRATK